MNTTSLEELSVIYISCEILYETIEKCKRDLAEHKKRIATINKRILENTDESNRSN